MADLIGFIVGWAIVLIIFVSLGKGIVKALKVRKENKEEATLKRRAEAQFGFGEMLTSCEAELEQLHEYKPDVSYEEYEEYLDSPEWKKKRLATIKRDSNCCQQCGSRFPINELEVHHIHYKRLRKEQPEDLITLCEFHHELLHEFHGEKAGYYPVLTMFQLTDALRNY